LTKFFFGRFNKPSSILKFIQKQTPKETYAHTHTQTDKQTRRQAFLKGKKMERYGNGYDDLVGTPNDDDLAYPFNEEDDYGDDFDQSFPNDYGYDDDYDVAYGSSNTPSGSVPRNVNSKLQSSRGGAHTQKIPKSSNDSGSTAVIGSVGVGASPLTSSMNMKQRQQEKSSLIKGKSNLTSSSAAATSSVVSGNSVSQSIVGGLKSSLNPSISTDSDDKPRILLMGLRRSGKSSIQKVVFQKMSPHETLFLESTNKIIKNDISNNSFVQFQIWDFPGQIDFFDTTFESDLIFGGCGALVFVIDAQDNYSDAITKLHQTVCQAHKVNPKIIFEVFIHKMDGISDDHKIQIQNDIQHRLNEELNDTMDNEGISAANIQIRYQLTSIYDHSIFEAFSKVIQKLIPQLPTLENLLDMLVSNSRLDKAFLFDVVSKIYIATDSSPVDNTTYELCSDMIDVVIDVSCIYGMKDLNDSFAYDEESSSVIKLNNGLVLYLREVNKYLALVCLINKDNFDKIGLINYNFSCFKKAISEVFEVRNIIHQRTLQRKHKK
jgi:Ras-related GTP-binding protein C/D